MAEENITNITAQVKIEYSALETSLAAVALCLILLLTILGNATICYVVFTNRRLWTEMNIFLVNLAFGDLAVGLLSMIFPLVTSIKREWIFSSTICQLNAACNSVLFCSTIFTHTVISIDRYLAIVHPMKKFMTIKKAFLMILSVWFFSLLVVIGPFFGWGHMEFNPTTLQCGYGFPRTKLESLYMVLLALLAFVLPLITMTVLYTKLYRSLRGHTRRMSTTITGGQRQSALKAQIRVGITFFVALIAFFICWAPFCSFIAIAVAVKSRTGIPRGLGLAAYWCGFVNSACNPFIIGIRNEQFRKAFAKILCCFCGRDATKTKSQTDGKRVRNTKTSIRTTDSGETKTTDVSFAKTINRSSSSDAAMDARRIRQALDMDVAQRERLPEYRPDGIVPINFTKERKYGIHGNEPPDVPFEQYLHIVGNSSFRESGV